MSLRASTSSNSAPPASRNIFASQPPNNASATSTPLQAPTSTNAVSSDLEQTLSMLSSHRSVLGYLLVTRGSHPSIIRHSGVVFEGEQGKRYAAVVARIVESVQTGLEEVRGDDGLVAGSGDSDADDIRFMRIRTRRHEIMISPDERYLLAVLHDPST